MKLTFVPLLLAAGVVIAIVAAIYRDVARVDRANARVSMLASEANLVVGEVPLVLPFIALSGYSYFGPSFSLDRTGDRRRASERFDAFHEAAASPDTAPAVSKLEVTIDAYGFDMNDSRIRSICPQLTQEWSRSVCMDPWAALRQAMPENRFYLVDDRHFEELDNYFIVGRESIGDQLRAMKFSMRKASVICDATFSSRQFCTAAIPIEKHLTAVWTVWDSTEESPQIRADREGQALVAFVFNAIASEEDFPSLLSEACKLRRPRSVPPPARDLHPCESSNLPEQK